MSAARRDELRLRRKPHGVPAGSIPEHGRNARDGTRPHDARRRRNLPARRFVVFRDRGGFYLDGAVVSAVVRSDRKSVGKISYLQRLSSPSLGRPANMNPEIDRTRLLSEIEALAEFSDAAAPAVTRIIFTPADLQARAWMKARCEDAGLTVRYEIGR